MSLLSLIVKSFSNEIGNIALPIFASPLNSQWKVYPPLVIFEPFQKHTSLHHLHWNNHLCQLQFIWLTPPHLKWHPSPRILQILHLFFHLQKHIISLVKCQFSWILISNNSKRAPSSTITFPKSLDMFQFHS